MLLRPQSQMTAQDEAFLVELAYSLNSLLTPIKVPFLTEEELAFHERALVSLEARGAVIHQERMTEGEQKALTRIAANHQRQLVEFLYNDRGNQAFTSVSYILAVPDPADPKKTIYRLFPSGCKLVRYPCRKKPGEYKCAILEKKLGAGNQATVYGSMLSIKRDSQKVLAIKDKTHKPRAVKIMHDQYVSMGTKEKILTSTLEQEMNGKLFHLFHGKALIRNERAKNSILIVRCFKGERLLDVLYLQKIPFTVRQRIDLSKKLLMALKELHDHGVVHRDLFPSNIMVERDEFNHILDVKMIDLGLSKEVGLLLKGKNASVCGSPEYAAPETWLYQSADGKEIDVKVDVFALGRIYWVLWQGIQVSVSGKLFGHLWTGEDFYVDEKELRQLALQGFIPPQTQFFRDISDKELAPAHKKIIYDLLCLMNLPDPDERASTTMGISTFDYLQQQRGENYQTLTESSSNKLMLSRR